MQKSKRPKLTGVGRNIAQRRACYRRGWDDCLGHRFNNPYQRSDWRGSWQRGFDACMSGQKFQEEIYKP